MAGIIGHRGEGGGLTTATATILFTDVEGSTEVRSRIGEAAADRLFLDHERLLTGSVERHGGRVLKTAGDGVMAAFESASNAVNAAVDAQRAVGRRSPDLHVRAGIAAGDVNWENDDCFGLPVITAARLLDHATGGQILVSHIVRWLAGERSTAQFESVGAFDLKGLPDPVEAFSVAWQPDAGTEAPAVPLPPALFVHPDLAFVGREDEWAALDQIWGSVLDGGRGAVLIGGEAGAGKTRLASEFARRCHETGAAVLLGACDDQLMIPYQPWVQALDHLLRTLPPEQLDPEVAADLGVLGPLLPRLDRSSGRAVSRSSKYESEVERYRLFAAVDGLVAEASGYWPLVIIVDDLHWASAETLALLGHLVRNGTSTRTLLIGTFRDTGDEVTDPLATLLADLRRVDGVTRLRVGGLDHDGVASLMRNATGQELDPAFRRIADEVAERSRGNAFFVGELWRHLLDSGMVVRTETGWIVRGGLDEAGVPASVREVVADRLARLSFGVRRVAELVAVAGTRVELRVLRSAAELPAAELSASLDQLATADLLEAVERPQLTYQFTHAIVRDTVAATVPAAARAGLHLRVAEALEAVYESDREPVLSQLALHFAASAALGTSGKAVYYSRQAAALAVRSVAYQEAATHLRRALELAESGSSVRVDVLVSLGHAELNLGRFAEAMAAWESGFELARDIGEERLAAEAALGYEDAVHTPGLPGDPAVLLVSKAITLIGDDGSPLRARLAAALARALHHAGRTAEGEVALNAALELAKATGDDTALAAALEAATISANEPHRILDYAVQLETVAVRLDDQWKEAYSTINQLRALTALGELGQAKRILTHHRSLAGEGRIALVQIQALSMDVIFAIAAGRFDAAEQAAEKAMSLGTGASGYWAAGVYGLQMFAIRREQGRLAEVAPVLEAVSAQAEDVRTGLWRPGLAVLYADLGMLAEAREQFEALAADDFTGIPRDAVWPGCVAFLAEVCFALGDQVRAETLYRELLPYREQTLMVGMTINLGPADRLLAGLAALLGRNDEATRHFEKAMAVSEHTGSPVWRAHVQLDWARFRAARGDHAAANTLATGALAVAEDLGMARVAEQCRALVTAPHLSVVKAPELPDGLSNREVEVLRLIATGCSNREIGEQLFISANTAANHVRAILQKTSCANRAEAAVYAARNQLLDP